MIEKETVFETGISDEIRDILIGSMTGVVRCPKCEKAKLIMKYKVPKLWCSECGYIVFIEFTEGESA